MLSISVLLLYQHRLNKAGERYPEVDLSYYHRDSLDSLPKKEAKERIDALPESKFKTTLQAEYDKRNKANLLKP